MLRYRLFLSFVVLQIILSSQAVLAQDSSHVWVENLGSPQYFAVLVQDVNESAQWYSSVFGLVELDRSKADDDAWQIVNLKNDHLSVEIIRDNRAQKVERAQGFFKVGFQVPDVVLVADRVEEATGERPRIVEYAPHQIRILQLKDPDGNTIQLHSPLTH